MKLRYTIIGVVLAVALAGGGIAAAIGSGGDDLEGPVCGDIAGVCSTDGDARPPDIVLGDVDDGDEPASQGERFVGLSESEAAALAEAEGRVWRVGRRDAEELALSADLMVGRVTFEIDDGLVISASIEAPNTSPPSEDAVVEDPVRADLIAAAVKRLLTVDNSFGGRDVFADILVARVIGSDPDQALQGLDLEMIAVALEELGNVRFVADADAEIDALFSAPPTGTAVVSVDRVLVLDDHAEVELRLWCGPLCGVFLTYEAVLDGAGWNITGTTGPIAIS